MGTEWPGSDFDLERFKIKKAVPDAADRAFVEGLNMARLLGIDVPGASGVPETVGAGAATAGRTA
jgi:hypothetical protein